MGKIDAKVRGNMDSSNTATTEAWLVPGVVISALTPLIVGALPVFWPMTEADARTLLVQGHPQYEAQRQLAAGPPHAPLLGIDEVRQLLGH